MIDYLGVWFAKWLTRSIMFALGLAVVFTIVDLTLWALEIFGVGALGCAALFSGRGWHQPWTGWGHTDG